MFAVIVSLLLSYVTVVSIHRIQLDRTEYFSRINVNFSWTINVQTQSIYIEIIAPINSTSSWVACGISDTGGMRGADIALISLYHNKVYDLHSNDFVLPHMDKIQNWQLLYLETFGTYSISQLKRHLLTCDEEDVSISTNRLKHNIMIAYNYDDMVLSKTSDYKLNVQKHQYQEWKEVNLFLDEHIFFEQNTESTDYVEYTIDNLTLSKTDGYSQYWCALFNVTEEKYVTGVRILDTTNYNIVHHSEILLCANPREFDTSPVRCGAYNYRYEMDCRLFIALATGSEISLPSEIYYLLEAGIYNLEVHLDLNVISNSNVDNIKIDGSGLRLDLTPVRKKLEMGLLRMETGEFNIPPKTASYQLSFAMNNQCTNKYLPPDGIDIIWFGGHMHYLGNKIKLDRIRSPNLVSTVFEIKKWDFDRQFAYPVHYTLYPNDTLRAYCIYDSTSRVNVTYYGLNSYNEMCQIYVGYVNKINDLNMVYGKPVIGNDKVLNPSYCGPYFIQHWNEIEDTKNIFENNLGYTSSNHGLEIDDDEHEICHALVYDNVNLISNDVLWRFDLPYITLYAGIFLILLILFSFQITERILTYIQPGIYSTFMNTVENRRKINIYVFSIIFYTVLLFVLLIEISINPILTKPECEIVYDEYFEENDDSLKFPHGIAVSANLLNIFFCVEMFYRLNVSWDLFLHHLFSIILSILIMTAIQTTFNVSTLKMGFYWLMQVATEQPIFIALFIRKLKLNIVAERNYPKMFYFSAMWHYITKITTTIFVWYYYGVMITNDGNECHNMWYIYDVNYSSFLKFDSDVYEIEAIDWKLFTHIAIGIISVLLFLLQMWQGFFFYTLGRPRSKLHEDVQYKSGATTTIELEPNICAISEQNDTDYL